MKRWIAAGAAVLALAGTLAGTAACTATHTGAKASTRKQSAAVRTAVAAKACEGGTYEWFNVSEHQVLTGASAAEEVDKAGGKLKNKLATLYTPPTTVTATGPSLAPQAALLSLAHYVGEAEGDDYGVAYAFTEVGRPVPALNDGSTTMQKGAGGRFVQYAFVKQVTADFRYSCSGGGTPTVGHATGWTLSGEGTLECSTSVGKNPDPAELDAARLSCGAGSVAAKRA